MRKSKQVREPIQAYLDAGDRRLLEDLVRHTGLAKAEIVRRGLRAFAQQALAERAPGWSLDVLIGALGGASGEGRQPSDLAAEHDRYLAEEEGGGGTADDATRLR